MSAPKCDECDHFPDSYTLCLCDCHEVYKEAKVNEEKIRPMGSPAPGDNVDARPDGIIWLKDKEALDKFEPRTSKPDLLARDLEFDRLRGIFTKHRHQYPSMREWEHAVSKDLIDWKEAK